MIFLLLVFGGGIGFFAYQFGQQQVAMEVTQTAMSRPTRVVVITALPSVTSMPTGTPVKEIVVVTAVVVVTATAPMDTNTPILLFTQTPSPITRTATRKPLHTQTPPPPPTNTPPESVLSVGQAWHQDGMAMFIPSYNIAPVCPDFVIEFPVELRNNTNQEVIFNFLDFGLEDNLQGFHEMYYRFGLQSPDCDGFFLNRTAKIMQQY